MTSLELDNHLPADFLDSALRRDVLDGLTADPKVLPPKWFYDERGSELFEQITLLPEYYPTRAERSILSAHASDVAALTGAATLVELGAGSAVKTRLLLSALRGTVQRYLPVDVSLELLVDTGEALSREYDDLMVHAVAADFEHHLDRALAAASSAQPVLAVFLGGTIGNFEPAARAAFLAGVRAGLPAGSWFLLGADLVKDPGTLVAAYDDAAGVTADFNLNVLRVVNRRLHADFDVDAFRHVALWDPDHEWIEMRLESLRDQKVFVADLDLAVDFGAGEQLRTEISAKFHLPGIAAELSDAGFTTHTQWTDAAGRFSLTLARTA